MVLSKRKVETRFGYTVSEKDLRRLATRGLRQLRLMIGFSALVCSSYAQLQPGKAQIGATSTTDRKRFLQVDRFLKANYQNGLFNGTVLVQRAGRIKYEKSFGQADAELGVPIDPQTVFRIASVTKTFTAAAIIVLASRGALALSDPVAKFLPDFPRGKEIRIEHLLGHSSGLGSVPPLSDPTREISLEEATERLRNEPLAFAPGTDDKYSGAGYVLLARIVEVASHRSFDDFLSEAIYSPLGLDHTGNSSNVTLVPGRALGYRPGPSPTKLWNVASDDLSPYKGEGSLLSSARDLAVWGNAIATKRLFDISSLSYPFGWGRRKHGARLVYEQTGLHNGFTSAIRVYPADRLVVVCLMNLQTGFFNTCAKDVASIVLGEPVDIPPVLQETTLSTTALDAFVGLYKAREDLQLELRRFGKRLLWRWANENEWRYVRPVSSTQIYLPDESAIVELNGVNRPASEVKWSSSIDNLVFKRVP